MKKIFIIFTLILAFVFTANAQKANKSFSNTQIAGDTSYFDAGWKSTIYSGFLGYFVTKADVADSLSILRMEGSMDGTNFVALTGNAALTTTTTDGSTLLYVTSPKYIYYRLMAAAATGDTVNLTNLKFIYKLED